ncbi:MAG: prephenate dehydrogenase/arogenate dehydrogenase family protein [Candidatus Aminicenantes bacterium]|nr:prephenate dehydrogenase/arogenate dehydrogenase family protein [Candidatus Aminicenantes bacterium]NIM77887.1 prephenate dehydrogenase/arogenate dehydrogenase family protein [Candidatus Aminicenantes bacterium]NIN17200.1 prephenate dehydrogenase/arogenate dehydrogenase family protein [Candidatus Aminicenantes bacterium]NIN41093.1 prephenate dehydrogenase/arogenate dehydrogenase family protein [Candidatus Aminicenantes bacterium]NIN83898.1 prephenate dehydrogenase/arogenate dehydrogenase fam
MNGVDFEDTLQRAAKLKYIDAAVPKLEELPEDVDILFLAAPIKTNIELLPKIVSLKKWKDLLITDMGSTKVSITRTADQLSVSAADSNWSFIGGHPMAGSERGGIGQANPFLFQNAVYVLTPGKTRQPADEKMALLINLLYKVGARIIKISPEFHDRLVAHISHLPYVVAVSLINFIAQEEKSDIFYQLAAGGYRDLTRIAQSSYSVWSHIFQDNKQNIISAVDNLVRYFNSLKECLEKDNFKRELQRAQKTRVKMPAGTKGFINPLVDIRVEIEDKPGVLADITTTLANEAINIKDIAILKIRENLGGVLELSFEDQKTARKASELLKTRGYRIFGV